MTSKLYFAAAAIALSALVSCGGSEKADYVDKSLITPGLEIKDTSATVTGTNNAVPNTIPDSIPGITPVIPGAQATTVTPGTQASPVNLVPQQNTMQINPATTTATTTTAPGMNPPHGQPGHRCDIQVGAPLNSKPAPATTVSAQPTTASAQPQQVTMTQTPSTVKTAPGMNPPHGEPGHRCEIAVGAPLDSKPAATTPASTQTPASTPPLLITPPKKDTGKN